jgi:glycerophosphoryl diester phosphodiesterase
VTSGDLAFDRVYQDNRYVGPFATTANTTPAFGRFCAAFMADERVGFTEPIFMTNEESDAVYNGVGGQTFSPLGGQTVAIVDGRAHALSRLGHFPKEASIVRPGTGAATVVFGLEDGPTTPDSQLYMYVGRKVPGNVLDRNGLINGSLYVFVADDPALRVEGDVQTGSIAGHWEKIGRAKHLDDVELEAAADALGAFGFHRLEDGAFSPSSDDDFFFVTTGEGPAGTNRLGRVYHLRLREDPLAPVRLDIVVNADRVFDPDGDGTYDTSGAVDAPLSPDNIDASAGVLMVQEDGTSPTRAVMTSLGRDGAIWRFDLDHVAGRTVVDVASAERVVELTPPGAWGSPPPAVTPGRWESSGIIDGTSIWGADTWLFDVQAHSPSIAPVANVVEDGQLLLLRPAS